MKKIMLLLIAIICISCNNTHKSNPAKFVENIDMKIILMSYELSSTDKFHNTQTCNMIIFETLTEPKLYRYIIINELPKNLITGKNLIHIDNMWIYNHKVGDTVHFDYLLKSKFLKKNR